MRNIINSILGKFDYKIEKLYHNRNRAEGYPSYLEEAGKQDMDVNEYIDNNLGWIKPLPVLEEVLYPILQNFREPVILELGPGTGRWSRYIAENAKHLYSKEYYLVDYSGWMTDFLKSYFSNIPFIKVLKNDGLTLPVNESTIDVIFCQGVFIESFPSVIYIYSNEFRRVLRPGGFCVFDYFNCDSEDGWNYFVDQTTKGNISYIYYPDFFIEKVFVNAGFKLENKTTFGKSNFIVFRKV